MSSVGWSISMAWLWTIFVTQVGGLCSFWRGFLGQARSLPGRSYSERDLESNDPLLPVDPLPNESAFEHDYAKKIEELQQLQGECSHLKAQIADLEAQLREKHASSTSRTEELQTQLQSERGILEAQLKEEHANSSSRIEELQTQLQSERGILEAQLKEEHANSSSRIEELQTKLQSERGILEAQLKEEHANSSSRIEELQTQLQSERGILEAQLKEEHSNSSSRIEELQTKLQSERGILEAQLKEEHANSSSRIEELQTQLQSERGILEAQLKEEHANSSSRIEELQTQLQSERGILEAQLKEGHANSTSRIEELQTQLQSQQSNIAKREDQLKRFQIYHEEQMAAQREELQTELQSQRSMVANRDDLLRKLQIYYVGQIAAQKEEVRKLGQQLELAEHQNSHDFAGGESFLDSGPTPHLLNKAVEKVNQASGNFTKLLMQALKSGGVDCTKVGKELAPSVSFERAAHTKYVYQALVCKVLFADFESECFNIEENASQCLDPEQPRKDNFQRFQELISLENPEELVYEDATDGDDFRRFCIKKANDLIAALSLTGAPGVEDVRALICGQVFGRDGISRGSESESQIKLALAFVKCALSVFLVHKLSFSMHPIARIFRLYKSVEFSPDYMEPVISLGDSDDEGADPIPLDVGFMVIPGFYVNRIVVHSRVYAVRRA